MLEAQSYINLPGVSTKIAKMVDKWVGKIAVVTGASAGIGAAILRDFAVNGINVIGLARRVEKVEEIIKKLGETKGKVYAYKCDVSDPNSVKETFKWIEEKFDVVHILVNNAGVIRNTKVLDCTDDSFQKLGEIINTNVMGLTQCTQEAYRLMKKSDDYGLIINVNSIAGHSVPFTEDFTLNIYPASKHAVTALSEVIRQELVIAKDSKVRITSLSPGGVATEIGIAGGLLTGEMAAAMEAMIATMPILKSEDVSHSVMFLLSTDYHVNITELTIRPVGEKV